VGRTRSAELTRNHGAPAFTFERPGRDFTIPGFTWGRAGPPFGARAFRDLEQEQVDRRPGQERQDN